MKFLHLITSALSIAIIVPAQANDSPAATTKSTELPAKGWYGSISAGGAWSVDPNYVFSGNGTAYDSSNNPIDWTTDSNGLFGVNGGISTEAAIGYKFGNQFRGDISYVYNRIDVDNGTASGTTTAGSQFIGTYSTSGSIATNSIFANVYYDFPVKSKFVPYVGLGLGWTGTSVDTGGYGYSVVSKGTTFNGSGTANGVFFSSFGYQVKAGISYIYNQVSSLFAEAIYQGNSAASAVNPDGLTSLSALNSFGVRAGFRYQFAK